MNEEETYDQGVSVPRSERPSTLPLGSLGGAGGVGPAHENTAQPIPREVMSPPPYTSESSMYIHLQ